MRNNPTQATLNIAYADRAYDAAMAAIDVRMKIGPVRRKYWAEAVYRMALQRN